MWAWGGLPGRGVSLVGGSPWQGRGVSLAGGSPWQTPLLTERQTPVKIQPCPKLRLRAVTRMHSSRMRTICCSGHLIGGVCPGGVSAWGCLPNGVSARGCLPGGSVCPGGCLSRRVCLPRGCLPVHPEGVHLPPADRVLDTRL